MVEEAELRPFERRVLRLSRSGIDNAEIARRFRRSPEFVERVIDLTRVPRHRASVEPTQHSLRPLERRVLKWRADGASTGDIASRFRREARTIEQIERLAHYKQAR